MLRRDFLLSFRSLAAAAATPAWIGAPAAAAPARRIVLQESPIAGFQYHDGEAAWPLLRVGMPLVLRREPDNAYDVRATTVWLGAHKLGYVPRLDNCAVSQMLDRGQPVITQIAQLERSANPWRRVRIQISA